MMQCDCQNKMGRDEMLQNIREINFTIIELGLYLNTHPDDERAICMHREYCKKYRDLTDKFQKVYGPLSIYFPCNKWRWLEEPWASFILGENDCLSTVSIKRKIVT